MNWLIDKLNGSMSRLCRLMILFFLVICLDASCMENNEHPFLSDDMPIKWNTLLPKYIERDVNIAIDVAQANIDAIASLPIEDVTFENTIVALEHADKVLDRAWSYVGHLDATCNSQEIRDVINKMLPKVAEFSANILLNDDLWLRIKTFAESERAKKLEGIEKKLLQDTVDGFRDSGADLPREQRERLKAISIEASQLSQKFSENVLDSRNSWEKYVDNVDELKGLPEMTLDILAEDAKRKGREGYRLSLNPSTCGKCMQYLENESLREELFRASLIVGRKDQYNNQKIVERLLELRQESATILGYKTYADITLKHRMAKNGDNALKFIENLHDRALPFFERDITEMEQFSSDYFGEEKSRIKPWNMAFLAEKHRQKMFDFDEEELRPYFKLENVIAGLFDVARALYGINFVEHKVWHSDNADADVPDEVIPVWHEDVKFFKAYEESGDEIGGLYLDMHPRETKQAGGWMSCLVNGHFDEDGMWNRPIAVICTNLTPSTETSPSLLSHREVETLFHEFGHALHHLFGKVKFESMNGCHVAWDFVELPSQIMENFCWDRTSLDLFAKHYITGDKMPDDLFDKMSNARNHLSASGMMNQLCFAKLDLELHQNFENYDGDDIEALLEEVLTSYRYPVSERVPTILLSFSHIFGGGYAAGYYSYKWAEVLDADAFSKFENDGVLSRKIGERFRKYILSQGDSKEADELYRDFMGRDPDIEALFIRSGLVD